MVTTAPSMAIRSSSFGIATISLDFSATLTCPSTRRWRAAKAETMWGGALPLVFWPERRAALPLILSLSKDDGDHLGRRADQRGNQATKHRWNASASTAAKMSPK